MFRPWSPNQSTLSCRTHMRWSTHSFIYLFIHIHPPLCVFSRTQRMWARIPPISHRPKKTHFTRNAAPSSTRWFKTSWTSSLRRDARYVRFSSFSSFSSLFLLFCSIFTDGISEQGGYCCAISYFFHSVCSGCIMRYALCFSFHFIMLFFGAIELIRKWCTLWILWA